MERIECDRMFVAVMESGSFSKAAQRLGVSAAQASKLISRLEHELGVQLITRTTRALSPTDIGLFYYERIRELLERFDELNGTVQNSSKSPSGRLRITAPLSFGIIQLTPALEAFARTYPDIQLDVDFSDRLVSLVDEGFDAALRIGTPDDSRLIARRLCSGRVVVVAAPDYLQAHGSPMTPDDLNGHECIIDTNFRDPTGWRFHKEGISQTVNIKARIRLSNAQTSLSAAIAGLGIARVPSFVASDALKEQKVYTLLNDHECETHSINVLYPSSRYLPSRVRVLIDFLVEYFPEPPAWDQGW